VRQDSTYRKRGGMGKEASPLRCPNIVGPGRTRGLRVTSTFMSTLGPRELVDCQVVLTCEPFEKLILAAIPLRPGPGPPAPLSHTCRTRSKAGLLCSRLCESSGRPGLRLACPDLLPLAGTLPTSRPLGRARWSRTASHACLDSPSPVASGHRTRCPNGGRTAHRHDLSSCLPLGRKTGAC
jgi:hypothetical protein